MTQEAPKRYRALVEMALPATKQEADRVIAARDAGEPIPLEEREFVAYEAGAELGFVPDESIPWLLEQGCIEEIVT